MNPVVIGGIAGVVAFVVGILIGHFGISQTPRGFKNERHGDISFDFHDHVSNKIISETRSKDIESKLRFLSSKPHLVGSERDHELANYIKNLWLQQGLDSAELIPYDFFLSFPNAENDNKVQIVEADGVPVFTSRVKETINGEPTEVLSAYLSHTPAGDVSGDLVYVNYGRTSDFDILESMGISVKNRICIGKFGKGFRGNKVENAAVRGAIGMILYLDPADVAQNGTSAEDVYPNTWWLPGDALQRGGAFTITGDPLTSGFPALKRAYRHPKEDCSLPKIPAQQIGYNDAERLLSILGGSEVPKDWNGGLNITYRLGPGFNAQNSGRKTRIATYNREEITTASNVIGWIKGSLEPDRYVLLGNHRDAWGYGAVDASSGTAVMLEVTRVLGTLLKEGWRPKRSLVFCSWAAEEQGMMGSTEWVEENLQKLMSRAVAYLNVDIAVMGSAFEVEGSPMLTEAIMKVANMVPHPEVRGMTLYEGWAQYYKETEGSEKPRVSFPGSGTDHAAFYFYAGVPSATFSYSADLRKGKVSLYPAYHTAYDTFDYMVKFFDPKFVYHQAMSRFLGVLVRYISDSVILPFNLTDYSQTMEIGISRLNSVELKASLQEHVDELSTLEEAVTSFETASAKFHHNIKSADLHNLLEVRQINDQLLMSERFFIKPQGLPGRSDVRHLVFSPSQFDSYGKTQFPVIYDSLSGIQKLTAREELQRRETIKEYISDLSIAFQAATNFIDPDFVVKRT